MRNIVQIHGRKSQKLARFSFGILAFIWESFEDHSHTVAVFSNVSVHFACLIFTGQIIRQIQTKSIRTRTPKEEINTNKNTFSRLATDEWENVCASNNNCMAILGNHFNELFVKWKQALSCVYVSDSVNVCVFVMNTLIWFQADPWEFFWTDFSSVYIDFPCACGISEIAKKIESKS